MYTLYGDGIHDDAPAIQEMLDSGISAVVLPVPEKNYAIGSTLVIHSGQSLVLPEMTVIRLLPQSNCYMLINEKAGDHHISVEGGIWDYNNREQHPHTKYVKCSLRVKIPEPYAEDDPRGKGASYYNDFYRGRIMRFYGVSFLSVCNITYKDPVMYCVEFGYVDHFTVENIRFDFNYGNPVPVNMDGVHVDGGCHFGYIHNIQGTAYDDMVAINANDLLHGPISDIEIDGVFGKNSLRGVRILSTHSPVERISISNVFGTYYQNPVSLTYYYYDRTTRGFIDHISIKNVLASNAERLPIYQKPEKYQFALLYIDSRLDIGHLRIENVGRNEKLGDIETIRIRPDTKIKRLTLEHICHENHTGKSVSMMINEGEIDKLFTLDLDAGDDVVLDNRGIIRETVDLG